VPKRFLDTSIFPDYDGGTDIDKDTGLPIMHTAFRIMVADEFSDCVRRGKNWALLKSDADNLKKANSDLGRLFGDMVIRYGAAMATNSVSELNLSKDTKIFAARPSTGGADEVEIWLFDLEDKEMGGLRERLLRHVNRNFPIEEPNFTFSTTADIVTSRDGQVRDLIKSAREYMHSSHERGSKLIAYDEFNKVNAIVDDMVKKEKDRKDISRLDLRAIRGLKGSTDMKKYMLETFGDGRSSTGLLGAVFSLIELEAKIEEGSEVAIARKDELLREIETKQSPVRD